MIVITVGNGSDIISSHIPKECIQQVDDVDDLRGGSDAEIVDDSEEQTEIEVVGTKRKSAIRGPGNKDFRSAKPLLYCRGYSQKMLLKSLAARSNSAQQGKETKLLSA